MTTASYTTTTSRHGRRRRTPQERAAIEQEALGRARNGENWSNWPAIIEGFTARGIPESDIRPRENVLTYHAWRALGRQVRRGEHGVRVLTYVPMTARETDPDTGEERDVQLGRRPKTAVVFHVTQTDPLEYGPGEHRTTGISGFMPDPAVAR